MRAASLKWWADNRPPVAVGIPMTWALHRTAMVQYLHLAHYLKPTDHLLLSNETAVVSEARNHIIRSFLSLPADVQYLVLFDDDMVVWSNVVDVLTWRQKPIVSGVCTTKTEPFMPVAYFESPVGDVPKDSGLAQFGEVAVQYHTITDIQPRSGLHEVHGVGAACLCIRRDVLEAIEAPWFKFEGSGEDLYFCRKAREAGFPILIDTHVMPGHIGEVVGNFDRWLDHKDAAVALHGEQDYRDLIMRKAS